jgi:hypothetical protein
MIAVEVLMKDKVENKRISWDEKDEKDEDGKKDEGMRRMMRE